MIRKELVLKVFAIAAALAMVLSLCACSKELTGGNTDDPENTTKGANVPDHVVPPITQAQPGATTPTGTDEPEASANPDGGDDGTAAEPDDIVHEEGEPYAAAYLSFINSDRVHVKFTEVFSYDGENISGIGREAFVDGNNVIFISDSVTTFYRSGIVTTIYHDEGVYWRDAADGGFGLIFGYPDDYYTLLSTEQTDLGFSEIYSVSGMDITSTWSFDSDGKLLQVTDRGLDEGYFTFYNFEIIDSDISGMDFSIPDGFVEVDPEDYDLSM